MCASLRRATALQMRCRDEIGGASRDRTDDLLHAMQALSQLSYSPPEKGAQYSQANLASQCRLRMLGAFGSFGFTRVPRPRCDPRDG